MGRTITKEVDEKLPSAYGLAAFIGHLVHVERRTTRTGDITTTDAIAGVLKAAANGRDRGNHELNLMFEGPYMVRISAQDFLQVEDLTTP